MSKGTTERIIDPLVLNDVALNTASRSLGMPIPLTMGRLGKVKTMPGKINGQPARIEESSWAVTEAPELIFNSARGATQGLGVIVNNAFQFIKNSDGIRSQDIELKFSAEKIIDVRYSLPSGEYRLRFYLPLFGPASLAIGGDSEVGEINEMVVDGLTQMYNRANEMRPTRGIMVSLQKESEENEGGIGTEDTTSTFMVTARDSRGALDFQNLAVLAGDITREIWGAKVKPSSVKVKIRGGVHVNVLGNGKPEDRKNEVLYAALDFFEANPNRESVMEEDGSINLYALEASEPSEEDQAEPVSIEIEANKESWFTPGEDAGRLLVYIIPDDFLKT